MINLMTTRGHRRGVGGLRIGNQPSIHVEACTIDIGVVKRELPGQVAALTALRWRHRAVSCVELR